MPNYVIRFSFQECNYFNEVLSSFYDYAFQNKSKIYFKINSKIEKNTCSSWEKCIQAVAFFVYFKINDQMSVMSLTQVS